jgi:predicted permease
MRRPLLLLFAAVLLVLFIACVNLAGLLFARSSVRRREVALRQAIGASRGRIVRQLLTESLVVNLAGAITGLFLARFALELIKAEGLRNMDASAASALDLAGATINGPVLWFGVLLAILSGTIAALVPSFKSADLDLNSTLKQGEMTGNTSRQHRRSRKALIAAEVAVSAMLLVGATLMVRSFILLEGVHLGFDPNNLHVAQLSFASERYASPQAIAQFEQNVLEQLHALPGVEGAAAVSSAPLASGLNLGMPSVSGTQCGNGIVEYRAISPGYFATMAAPILRGRSFAFSDSAQSTPVVIVNEVLAKMCWPSADAIGSQLSEEGDAPRQVVGIVRNMSEYGVGSEVPPIMFVPQVQVPRGINDLLYQSFGLLSAIVIRTSTPMDLGTQVERAITAVDPQQPVVSVGPMSDLISASTSVPRFLMTLMSSFAAIALALTLAGLYALMSYFVTQRTREIGIRMALGAARSDVLRMVIGEGAMLVLVGTIIGLGGAIIASRPMASLVFGIKPNDPLTFAAAAIVLIMAALWASYAPARRASRMDPMTALRAE